ncbi:hypothetical protein D5086_031253 [Populus alba]|uniref:Uncharacterized protein n=1 Tax=Populus alba TaxID=43335 RepID=A0ACC4AQT6_POPAL
MISRHQDTFTEQFVRDIQKVIHELEALPSKVCGRISISVDADKEQQETAIYRGTEGDHYNLEEICNGKEEDGWCQDFNSSFSSFHLVMENNQKR